jgi:hypothetical protein
VAFSFFQSGLNLRLAWHSASFWFAMSFQVPGFSQQIYSAFTMPATIVGIATGDARELIIFEGAVGFVQQ